MVAASALRFADRQLERQIACHLAETKRPGLRGIAVKVADGNVTLRGSVASFYEKQIAIQTCRVLAGIERLTDALDVG
jgi:osmotically-inducible protein OsmY